MGKRVNSSATRTVARGCVLVWALLALAGAAHAQTSTYRVAVLELGIDDVSDALARSLTDQIREQLRAHSEFALSDTHVSLEQLSLAQDCDPTQTACLDKIARGLQVDGLVFGRLKNESGAAVAKLQRYDLATQTVNGSALATLALGEVKESTLQRKAGEIVADLFELEAARSPFARGELAPRNAAIAEQSAVEQPVVSPRKVAGYALLGGAVLSAGLSVLSFAEINKAQDNDSFDRYRRAVGQMRPTVHDVCDEANAGQSYGLEAAAFQRVRSSCSTGRTFEVLQFIFLGSAVLSSGLSAYMLLGGESKRESPQLGIGDVNLYPAVQKSGASLAARLKF
ncbi:MAG TPA: hypothetical protein VHZ95_07565 [Polyangiales bacterium]|nr:hypothetical protein [Polyangiales bacterium]